MTETAIKTVLSLVLVGLAAAYARAAGAGSARPGRRRRSGAWATMGTPFLAQQMVAEGVVLSVSWQQSALLLQTAEGFSLVAVDPAAKIDDAVGAIHSLSDLQPGDVIEYHGESFGGILIVDQLRVISISDEKKVEDRRPPNQPHETPSPASYAIPTRHD